MHNLSDLCSTNERSNHAPEMGVEERREYINRQITLWVGNLRLNAALTAKELGQYSGMQKALLLRNSLLVGVIRHCRLNPRADTRMPILALITFLADNNDGMCWLSVTRMCEIFVRSRQTIVDSIASLERDGQIGVSRKDGMPSCYWPLIPAALAELSANPTWFVDALSTKPRFRLFGSPEEAIAAATAGKQSTPPDQSTRPDQSSGLDQHRSTLVDEPVNSSRRTGQEESCSIFLGNSPCSSQEEGGPSAAALKGLGPHINGQTTSRACPRESASASTREVEEALKLYNDAARQHGFTQCHVLTDARRKRLRKRLDDIRGVEAFKRALSAIPRDNFLMGRKPPRPGQEPFKLTIDRLMQTDGGMGDVLAKLFDLAGDGGPTGASMSQSQSELDGAIARLRKEQDEEASQCRH